MDLFPVSLEPLVGLGARERDEAAGLVTREKDACLLEQLPGRRDVIGDRILWRQTRQPLSRTVDAVAPLRAAVVIRCIHPSAGEHMSAAHERHPLVTADEKYLWPSRTVAENDDRRGRPGIRDEGFRRHETQY